MSYYLDSKLSLLINFRILLALLLVWPSGASAADQQESKTHKEIIARTPIYDNPQLTDYVSRVGQEIAAVSGSNKEYKFYVLDDPGINAFTPGKGLIYINRGLLVLMTSEGQLAGVLGHEIGHNTGNHLGRLKTQKVLGGIAAVAASVLVGNSKLGDAITISNQARVSGYGRDMELEADASAAEFLYAANYDPEEMLGVLGVLKDEERFRGSRSEAGSGSYHGVFSSHPRSDKRLQQVISQAGTLPPGEQFRGREELRKALTGVVFGQNYNGNKRPDQERYTSKGLGITFLYPQGWSRVNKGKSIILKNADKTIQLKITIEKTVDKSLDSTKILEAKYPKDLTDVEKFDEKATKDLGTLGKRPQQRVAAVRAGRNTFHLQGIAKNNLLTDEQDKVLVEIIKSFRRASRQDISPDEVKKIYFHRLAPGETFASLAKNNELGKYTEGYLRLMNGYYPKGEAEPGTYIKLVKSIKNEKPK